MFDTLIIIIPQCYKPVMINIK